MAKSEKSYATPIGADTSEIVGRLREVSGAQPEEGKGFAPATKVAACTMTDAEGNMAVALVKVVATRRGPQGGTFLGIQLVAGDCAGYAQGTALLIRGGDAQSFAMDVASASDLVESVLRSQNLESPVFDAAELLPQRAEKPAPAAKPADPRRQGARVVS